MAEVSIVALLEPLESVHVRDAGPAPAVVPAAYLGAAGSQGAAGPCQAVVAGELVQVVEGASVARQALPELPLAFLLEGGGIDEDEHLVRVHLRGIGVGDEERGTCDEHFGPWRRAAELQPAVAGLAVAEPAAAEPVVAELLAAAAAERLPRLEPELAVALTGLAD